MNEHLARTRVAYKFLLLGRGTRRLMCHRRMAALNFSCGDLHILRLAAFVIITTLLQGGCHGVPTNGGVAAASTPSDCSYEAVGRLTCRLSSINSRLERTDFSVVPNSTTSLRVVCSDTRSLGRLEAGGFATLTNLRELVIQDCALHIIPAQAFKGAVSLESLSLQTGSEVALRVEVGAFSGLEQTLTSLDLSRNALRQLPPGELCRLTQLTTLNLSQNRFGAVADLGVAGCGQLLPRLAHLDLGRNELTSLEGEEESSLLLGWPGLQSLSLNGNFVRFVGPGRRGGNSSNTAAPSQLRLLDLANNQISQLPTDLLAAHPLRELRLANNSLSALPANLLAGQLELELLDLSGNILSAAGLPAGLTTDLPNLLHLDLGHNHLEKLGPELTAPLANLQVLRLSANRLAAITLSANLVNLASLDLSANQLTEMGVESLAGLTALSQLNLNQNRLTALHPAAFANTTELLILDLSHNRLTGLPPSLRHLARLQTLDLSSNLIADLEVNVLSGMASLWRLQMAGNQVDRIPANFFGSLTALQVLDLSANRLSGRLEPGVLDRNLGLRAVRLDGNQLRQVDGVFSKLPQLIWLNVSDNSLQEFDYAHVPPTLHWLDISHNQIPELSNYFRIEEELAITYLDASFNRLRQVAGDSLPASLEILLLNDNAIVDIAPYTFFEKENLTKVDLSVNEIAGFSRNSILLPLANSKETLFFLGGNPIVCDCDMTWFKSINVGDSVQNFPIIADLESIYCRLVYTQEQTFVPLVEARSDQFLCSYQTHCFSLCQCCQFDSCDCEMTCPAGCTCYHDNSWTKNIIQCSSAQISMIPDSIPMDATEVFMDGNRLEVLRSHTFIGRKNLRSIHLNSSNIEKIENQTFNGLRSLMVLHLENNSLKSLHGFEFSGLSHLRELYLQGNQITSIHNATFRALKSLEVLFLQGNLIIDFPVWQLAANPYLVSIRIAENLWSCDCDYLHQFRRWLHDAGSKVNDVEQLICTSNKADDSSNGPRQIAAAMSSCPAPAVAVPVLAAMPMPSRNQLQQEQKTEDEEKTFESYLPLMIAILSSFSAIVLLAFIAVCFRHSIRLWWRRSRYGGDAGDSRVLDSPSPSSSPSSSSQAEEGGSSGKLFDAYVAYSAADAGLVNQILWRELETAAAAAGGGGGSHRFRLCLHHRDLPPTASSGEAVLKVAEASRTVIIALSSHFLATEWSRPDFRAGLMAALADGRKPVIFLLLPSSGPLVELEVEPSLRLLLHTSLLLSWTEPGCLTRLQQAILYAGGSAPFHQPTGGGGDSQYYYGGGGLSPAAHHYYGSGGHFQTIYSEVPEKMSISHI